MDAAFPWLVPCMVGDAGIELMAIAKLFLALNPRRAASF